MIYTSYFAATKDFPPNITPVSISRFPPDGYKGKQVTHLAPSEDLLTRAKSGAVTHEEYTAKYSAFLKEKVSERWIKAGLSGMFPKTADGKPIWESQTDHAAFVCFEKPGDFCHRHILADHLSGMGIPVEELDVKSLKKASIFGINNGIVCHQVNCRAVMGAGVAKVIKEAFPEVYESYMRSFDGKSAEDLYGKVGIVNVSKTLAIANVYSQLDYGNPAQTGKVYTNAEYLARAVDSVCKRFPEKTVYVPEGIGCGFGGGNWSEIKALLASLGHSNLYLLDTKAQKARPLVASVSRQEFNERLSEIISNGVEKTNREFGVLAKPAEWFTKKEEEAFSLLKEIVLADEDEDVPENVAKYFSGYLAERAIAHGKTDLVDEMVETEKEISALYKGLLEWEHTKDEKNEQNEPILDGR